MASTLGDASIPMSNDQSIALNSGDAQKVETSIPLSVKQFQPVDDAANQMKAYKLADAGMNFTEKKQEFDTQQSDKRAMDTWLQMGGKLNSPEDFDKAVAEVGPQLSPEGQIRLNKLRADHLVSDIDLTKKISQDTTEQIAVRKQKLSDMAETLDPILDTYKNSRSMSETPEQKDSALQAYNASKDAALKMFSELKDASGKPVYTPEELKALAPLNPEQLEGTIDHTKYGIAKHEQVLEDRVKESTIVKNESQAVLNTAKAEDLPEHERIAQSKLDQMIKSKSLTPENVDSVATAIAKYNLPPLSPMAIRTAQGMAVMSKVIEDNPDYDAKKFKAMQGTLDKYTYGKGSEVITSFKTANAHLDALSEVIDKLNNADEKSINRLGNAFAKEFGLSTAPGDFDAMKQAIAQEIEKTFSGSAGALADRQKLEKSLDAAKSPENLKSVVNDYKRLLQGKIGAAKDSYESGMVATPNFELKPKTDAGTPAGFPKGIPGTTDKGKAEQMKILTDEKAEIEKRVAGATTPEDKARATAALADITKEIASKSGGAVPAASKPTTSNW